MAEGKILADRYMLKTYACPSVTITAGTIGTIFGFGSYSDVSIPGYTAKGAFIGNVNHANQYTPLVMASGNRLYRWYVRVHAQEYTVPASDWTAVVIYEKN